MATRAVPKPTEARTARELAQDIEAPLDEGRALVWFLEKVQREFESVLGLTPDDYNRIHWATGVLYERLDQVLITIAEHVEAALDLLKAEPTPGGKEAA